MIDDLFFPKLTRQPESAYYNSFGDFYSATNYKSNYPMVAMDCKHRCVYCDVTEKECGGEHFSLDHFRPKSIFSDKFNGILVRHPHNLHLSCQKCNILKGKDWQGCVDKIDGPSYIDGKGYIDRFRQNISSFLEVDLDGRIRIKQRTPNDDGPGKYLINRLHLNRPNRVYLRKKRVVDCLVKNIEEMLKEYTNDILNGYINKTISPEKGMRDIVKLEEIRCRFINIKENIFY